MAVCPGCGIWSRRVHSSYLCFPADVPSGGRRVTLCLRVRRFLCPVTSCGQRTFAEQLAGLTPSVRSADRAAAIDAGRGRARACRSCRCPLGERDWRFSEPQHGAAAGRALSDPDVPAPRVVGVDEYATRNGRHYGTVLVDVESRRPVDVLPDREASSLAAWLAKRPGVEVVCRDRAPFFAEGATAGAPSSTGRGPVASLAQPERGHRAMRRRPPRMPAGPGAEFSPIGPRAEEARRPLRLALAKGTPLRRPHPRQPRGRPRTAGGRAQPEGDRPPAPHDLPHRQTLR
ncbi:transposase [Streptomyces sp. NPDC054861]